MKVVIINIYIYQELTLIHDETFVLCLGNFCRSVIQDLVLHKFMHDKH